MEIEKKYLVDPTRIKELKKLAYRLPASGKRIFYDNRQGRLGNQHCTGNYIFQYVQNDEFSL